MHSQLPKADPLFQALSNPTAREMWRHSFADAKRRKFKFDVFKVRVSVDKICKFSKIWIDIPDRIGVV
nr:hypothetical protein [uncultured Campylobacter sp.]